MILVNTIAHRWYAFAFIPVFFYVAIPERGALRALRFLAVAALVSFAAEYASTHGGFPYGRYSYIAHGRGKELYLSNVPFFVPVTFGVVVWAGRALAAPRAFGFGRAGAASAGLLKTRARGAAFLALGGGLAAAALDLIIDPMTLRGNEWFLGSLYRYRAHGGWWGVPWSNAFGWILVAAAIILIDELLDASHGSTQAVARGPLLAIGICTFFIVIAIYTTNGKIAIASMIITVILFSATLVGTRPHLGR